MDTLTDELFNDFFKYLKEKNIVENRITDTSLFTALSDIDDCINDKNIKFDYSGDQSSDLDCYRLKYEGYPYIDHKRYIYTFTHHMEELLDFIQNKIPNFTQDLGSKNKQTYDQDYFVIYNFLNKVIYCDISSYSLYVLEFNSFNAKIFRYDFYTKSYKDENRCFSYIHKHYCKLVKFVGDDGNHKDSKDISSEWKNFLLNSHPELAKYFLKCKKEQEKETIIRRLIKLRKIKNSNKLDKEESRLLCSLDSNVKEIKKIDSYDAKELRKQCADFKDSNEDDELRDDQYFQDLFIDMLK